MKEHNEKKKTSVKLQENKNSGLRFAKNTEIEINNEKTENTKNLEYCECLSIGIGMSEMK